MFDISSLRAKLIWKILQHYFLDVPENITIIIGMLVF